MKKLGVSVDPKKARAAGARRGRERVKGMRLDGEERPDPRQPQGPTVKSLHFIPTVMGDS